MKIEIPDSDPSSSVFEMDGLISNSNYVAKKTTMVLFINGMCFFCNCNKSFPHFMSYFHDQEKVAVLRTLYKTGVILAWFPKLPEPLLLKLLCGIVYMRVLNLKRSFDFPGTIHKLNFFYVDCYGKKKNRMNWELFKVIFL